MGNIQFDKEPIMLYASLLEIRLVVTGAIRKSDWEPNSQSVLGRHTHENVSYSEIIDFSFSSIL